MLKKWLKYISIGLVLILLMLFVSKPSSQGVLGEVKEIVPTNSRVTLQSERDYYFFNAIQIRVQESGDIMSPGKTYTLTYMGILWQTIDFSEDFNYR